MVLLPHYPGGCSRGRQILSKCLLAAVLWSIVLRLKTFHDCDIGIHVSSIKKCV